VVTFADISERKRADAALRAAHDALAEERALLAERVRERTAELGLANSELARTARAKDEFLAAMSHELRTPLTTVLGIAETLEDGLLGPVNDQQVRAVKTIQESGFHLLDLINDILDVAKVESGKMQLVWDRVPMQQLCDASLRLVRQAAQRKGIEMSCTLDPQVRLMRGDSRRLKQLLVNLLSNAVKFTPEGGKIGLQIQGQQAENKVLITVWDTGIGIKENDFQRLFQPFVQLDSGLARESTGTGLGLVLVAQMARMHGGSVNVSSDPGNGSRFTIILPWEPALQMDIAERLKTTGKFRAIRPGQPQETILLVEDTQEVVMIVKDYLEIAGYKVVTAQDGLDGITQAKLFHPDLILMDIQMPRMDGLEATQRLRQDPEFKYTPIIALTALAMPSDRERCLAAGMDEYISKPVNLRGLVKIIQSCLSTREERPYPDEHHSDRR
jgi:signal transduction histidine kinase/ActR/RegA family two-component response regulator